MSVLLAVCAFSATISFAFAINGFLSQSTTKRDLLVAELEQGEHLSTWHIALLLQTHDYLCQNANRMLKRSPQTWPTRPSSGSSSALRRVSSSSKQRSARRNTRSSVSSGDANSSVGGGSNTGAKSSQQHCSPPPQSLGAAVEAFTCSGNRCVSDSGHSSIRDHSVNGTDDSSSFKIC